MKFIALIAALISTTSFAQAERQCPTQKLTCKLEKVLPMSPRILLSQTVTEYDGTNSDEPSVEPAYCSINSFLQDDDGISFYVSVSENEQMTNIYTIKSSEPAQMLAGDTAFNATTGKAFYYRYNSSLLTCTLK